MSNKEFDVLSTGENGVELFEQLVGSVGCAVYDRVVVFEGDIDLFQFHEFRQVCPVVRLAIQFEAVVELVHLDGLRIVSAENFSVYPAIGQVTLGIGNLVGQV